MNNVIRRAIFTTFLLVGCQEQQNESFDLNETRVIPSQYNIDVDLENQPSPRIGAGFEADYELVRHTRCLSGDIISTGDMSGELIIKEGVALSDRTRAFSLNTKAGISGLFDVAKTNASISKIETNSQLTASIQFNLLRNVERFIPNGEIRPYNGLSTNASDFEYAFRKLCGTHFISEVSYGTSFTLDVMFLFSSEKAKAEFKSGMSLSIPDSPFTLETGIEAINKSNYRDIRLAITSSIFGGNGEKLTKILEIPNGTSVIECSTNQDRCPSILKAINSISSEVLDTALKDSTGTMINYKLTKYSDVIAPSVLVPTRLNYVSNEVKSLRERLAGEIERQMDLKSNVAIDFNHVNRSKESRQYYGEALVNRVQTQVDAYDDNIETLLKSLRLCFEQAEYCTEESIELTISKLIQPEQPIRFLIPVYGPVLADLDHYYVRRDNLNTYGTTSCDAPYGGFINALKVSRDYSAMTLTWLAPNPLTGMLDRHGERTCIIKNGAAEKIFEYDLNLTGMQNSNSEQGMIATSVGWADSGGLTSLNLGFSEWDTSKPQVSTAVSEAIEVEGGLQLPERMGMSGILLVPYDRSATFTSLLPLQFSWSR